MKQYTEFESAAEARKYAKKQKGKLYGIAFLFGMALAYVFNIGHNAGQARKIADIKEYMANRETDTEAE